MGDLSVETLGFRDEVVIHDGEHVSVVRRGAREAPEVRHALGWLPAHVDDALLKATFPLAAGGDLAPDTGVADKADEARASPAPMSSHRKKRK